MCLGTHWRDRWKLKNFLPGIWIANRFTPASTAQIQIIEEQSSPVRAIPRTPGRSHEKALWEGGRWEETSDVMSWDDTEDAANASSIRGEPPHNCLPTSAIVKIRHQQWRLIRKTHRGEASTRRGGGTGPPWRTLPSGQVTVVLSQYCRSLPWRPMVALSHGGHYENL